MKTLQEFNDEIENLGEKLFGEKYNFSSTDISTIIYGEPSNKKRETKYNAVIFFNSNKSIRGASVNIEQVGEILALEYAKLVAEPSSDEINIGV